MLHLATGIDYNFVLTFFFARERLISSLWPYRRPYRPHGGRASYSLFVVGNKFRHAHIVRCILLDGAVLNVLH